MNWLNKVVFERWKDAWHNIGQGRKKAECKFILPDAQGPEMGVRGGKGEDSQVGRRFYKDGMAGGQKFLIKESRGVFK
ncbi:hypothetical protein ACQP3J_31970 [Escherichia coli]